MNLAFSSLVISTLFLIISIILTNNILMAIGELFAGLSGIIIFIEIFVQIIDKFHFLKLLSAVILISTGLGTFNTYIYFQSEDQWNQYVANNIGLNIQNLSISEAQLFVNLFCFILLTLSLYNKQKKYHQTDKLSISVYLKVANLSNKKDILLSLLFISLIISLCQAFLLYSGVYGFLSQGLASEKGIINPGVSLVISVIPIVNLSLGFLIFKFNYIKKNISPILLIPIYTIILAVQCQWNFISGSRRELIYTVILFAFGLRLSLIGTNKIINQKNRFRIFVISSCFLLSIYSGIYFTSLLRFLVNENQNIRDSSPLEIIEYTFQNYQKFNQEEISSKQRFQASLDENLSTRTFILSSLALIIDKAHGKPPLLGIDFITNFIKSIPNILYPNKYIFPASELLYSQKFGIPYRDFADTYCLSAFVDFYWLGAFIYPTFFYFIFFWTEKLIPIIRSPIFLVFSTAKLINLCLLGGESSLVSFWGGLRDLLIVGILILIVKLIFVQRSQLSN